MPSIEKTIGYEFRDKGLLTRALTHSSAAQDNKTPSNERLEFLGDRVLGLVVAGLLLDAFPDEAEGAINKRHMVLVEKGTLHTLAAQISLATDLILSENEDKTGGRKKPAILADALEALIAAVYLDGGLDAAKKFVTVLWSPLLNRGEAAPIDAKSELQEWAQERGLPLPAYAILSQSGPGHAPVFVVEVSVEGFAPARGTGATKRIAEKAAALKLLDVIGKEHG